MANNLTKFTSIESYASFIQSGATLPNVSKVMTSGGDYLVEYNPMEQGKYFWIFARGTGEVSINIQSGNPVDNIPWVDYSKDNGATWSRVENENSVVIRHDIPVNAGDTIIFKAESVSGTCYNKGMNGKSNNQNYISGNPTQNRMYFSSTCDIEAGGNIASLMYGDDFEDKTTIKTVDAYTFHGLFAGCQGLISAKNLLLPLNGTALGIYQGLFQNCYRLVEPPKFLPIAAPRLQTYCNMFLNCSSLTSTPIIQATSLGHNTCGRMFEGCTSLVYANPIPTKTISSSTFNCMFRGCTSLTDMPEIEATSVNSYSFDTMFSGCTSLTGTTVLKAANINYNGTYRRMFMNCTSLKHPATLSVTTMGISGCASMYEYCTSLETATVPSCACKQACYMAMYKGCTSLTDTPSLTQTNLGGVGCYMNMFNGCTSLTGVPASLPATALQNQCYDGMFRYCSSLRDMPNLPATASKNYCYSYMFANCPSLTGIVDTLALTSTTEGCCQGMFYACTGLTRACNLKSTSIAKLAYYNMFCLCYGITNPPVMSATTTLGDRSMLTMFSTCSSMTSAPQFTITGAGTSGCYATFYACKSLVSANNVTLKGINTAAYASMFSQCTALKYTPIFQTTAQATTSYSSMFYNCSSLQTVPTINAPIGSWACCNMFQNCTSLTASTKTITVPSIAGNAQFLSMFYGCTSLTTCPVAFNFDPATATGTQIYDSTFYGCTSLTGGVTTLPIAETVGQKSLFRTFYGCTALKNPPQITTPYKIGISGMSECFYNCTSMTSVPSMTISAITGSWAMGRAFQNCSSITNASTLNLTATQLYNNAYYCMFTSCGEMVTPPTMGVSFTLSGSSMGGMFENCVKLKATPVMTLTGAMSGSWNANNMFRNCTQLTGMNVTINTTNAPRSCFSRAFELCTSLTTAPNLPTTTLQGQSYEYMFNGCSSLVNAPTIGATSLSAYCCQYMFQNCTSLETGPNLPAATLKTYCYQYMFNGCSHLTGMTIAATTLDQYCMRYMFQNCTSMVESPVLKGTTLKNYCYVGLFNGCTSLNKITSYFTTAPSNTYTQYWVQGVPTVTTGQYLRKGTYTTRGTNAIPTNWVISTAP